MCSALVRWRGLCRIFACRTRHTKCVARLFVRLAYVICISLRGLRNCLPCLVGKRLRVMVVESYELYTVCSALVRWRGLCRIFAYRTRHTLCVAHLFFGVADVGSLLIERGIQSV